MYHRSQVGISSHIFYYYCCCSSVPVVFVRLLCRCYNGFLLSRISYCHWLHIMEHFTLTIVEMSIHRDVAMTTNIVCYAVMWWVMLLLLLLAFNCYTHRHHINDYVDINTAVIIIWSPNCHLSFEEAEKKYSVNHDGLESNVLWQSIRSRTVE